MVTVMRECLSLGRKKRVVPFLAEGEAKATVLGGLSPSHGVDEQAVGATADSAFQILWSFPAGWGRGGGWLQLSGLVAFTGKRAQGKNKS